MSEEEIKAINNFKEILENLDEDEQIEYEEEIKDYKTLLNLIEKQQEEIDTYKETENDYEHEVKRYEEQIEKQQKEIDKLKSENQIFQRIKNGTTIIFKAKKKYIIEDKINKYYISKNKIRAKIEELQAMSVSKDIYFKDVEKLFKELLEE